jgi:hypothetical protein
VPIPFKRGDRSLAAIGVTVRSERLGALAEWEILALSALCPCAATFGVADKADLKFPLSDHGPASWRQLVQAEWRH